MVKNVFFFLREESLLYGNQSTIIAISIPLPYCTAMPSLARISDVEPQTLNFSQIVLEIITFWCSLTNVKFRLSAKLLGVYNRLRFNVRIYCVWISMAFTALIRRNGSWCNYKFEYFKINLTSGSLRNVWYLPEKLHKLTHLKQIYNDWFMPDWIYHRKQVIVLY